MKNLVQSKYTSALETVKTLKNKYGNCNVPQGRGLGIWVNEQRKARGKHPTNTK